MVVGEEKKRVEGKREKKNTFYFIILLDSLYYFIRLYIKIRTRMFDELQIELVK